MQSFALQYAITEGTPGAADYKLILADTEITVPQGHFLSIRSWYRRGYVDEGHDWSVFLGKSIGEMDSKANPVIYTVFVTTPTIERIGMSTERMIGSSLCSILTVDIIPQEGHEIPKNARIDVSTRAVDGDDRETKTEWIPLGTFYISTREPDKRTGVMRITALDSMRTADGDYEDTQTETYPMREMDAIEIIRGHTRIASLASGLAGKLSNGAIVDSPTGVYKNREVLNYIAAAEGGNFVIREDGALDFVALATAEETPVSSGAAQSVGDNGRELTISGVTLVTDDNNYVSTGDDSGDVIEADCAYATQPIVNALRQKLVGVTYTPKTAEIALLDPACQVGDTVTVAGEICVLYNYTMYLGAKIYFSLQNPPGNKEEDEYPYADAQERKFDRNFAENRTEIRKNAEAIEMIAVHNTATYRQGTIPDDPTEGDIWYCTEDISEYADVTRTIKVGDTIQAGQTFYFTGANADLSVPVNPDRLGVFALKRERTVNGVPTVKYYAIDETHTRIDFPGTLGYVVSDTAMTEQDADSVEHLNAYVQANRGGTEILNKYSDNSDEQFQWKSTAPSGEVVVVNPETRFYSALTTTYHELAMQYEAGKWYRYNGTVWELCEDMEFDDVWQSVGQLTVRADSIEQEVSGKVGETEVQSLIRTDLNGITLSTQSSGASSSGNTASIVLRNSDGTVNITGTVIMQQLNASTITAGQLNASLITTGQMTSDYIMLLGDMDVYFADRSGNYVRGGTLGYTRSTLNGDAGMHVLSASGRSEIRVTDNGCAMTTSGGEIYAGASYAGVTGLTWNSSSDRDLKAEIKYDADERLDRFFDLLRPAEFEFKGRKGRKHTGLIAQDVQDALAACGLDGEERYVGQLPHIKTGPDDTKEYDLALAYEEFISLCVRQIQTLKKRVYELEARMSGT